MNITLQGKNLDLSDELRQFVNDKMRDALRALGDMNLDPVQIDVELERTTVRHPHERDDEQSYRAEANVSLPGRLIRAEESATDVKQAVVKMKHTLTRELRRWHERIIDASRQGAREAKAMLADEVLEEPRIPSDEERWQDWEELEEAAAEEDLVDPLEEDGDDERDFV